MPTLPVDPQNTLNDNLYYTFYCNPQQEYILTSYMESKTFGPKGNETSKTNKDGGPDPYLYEVGSNLFISPLKPVGSWSFDEGAGTIANDSSGNNNNGILYGNPTWATDGQVNKALSFDGSDDYVDCGNDESLNITDKITVEAWVKPTTISGYNIITGRMEGSGYKGWIIRFISATKIEIFVAHNDTHIIYSPSYNWTNEWTHILFTYDGNNIRVYNNGDLLATSETYTGGISYTSTRKLNIGKFPDIATQYFNGIIDEVHIYNRALSAEEIKRHYEMSK